MHGVLGNTHQQMQTAQQEPSLQNVSYLLKIMMGIMRGFIPFAEEPGHAFQALGSEQVQHGLLCSPRLHSPEAAPSLWMLP